MGCRGYTHVCLYCTLYKLLLLLPSQRKQACIEVNGTMNEEMRPVHLYTRNDHLRHMRNVVQRPS